MVRPELMKKFNSMKQRYITFVPGKNLYFLSLTTTLFTLQIEQLKELSKQPDIYETLTRSLAPNIWELDDVKKGLLCQVQ